MVLSLRRAEIDDVVAMQMANTSCLPENYSIKYYWYHALTWPSNLHCATVPTFSSLKGYVLGKMEDNSSATPATRGSGHITSLAVLRDFRRLGAAIKMMKLSHATMEQVYEGKTCTLHVRESNRSAYDLYQRGLNYSVISTQEKYYEDEEDAYEMKKTLISSHSFGNNGKQFPKSMKQSSKVGSANVN